MTLAQAREDLLAQDTYDPALYKGATLDSEGNPVEDAEALTDLISKACIWWASLTYCCEDDNVALTLVVDQTTPYNCRSLSVVGKRILEPRIVIINDTPLWRRDGREYGLWTQTELERGYDKWRTASSAQPRIAVWKADGTLRLWPKTDALYTGKNFIGGWTIPTDLVNGADDDVELPVPVEDHSAIVRLALDYGTLPQMEAGRADKMFRNEQWWREQAERKRMKNKNDFLGRKARGGATSWMYG